MWTLVWERNLMLMIDKLEALENFSIRVIYGENQLRVTKNNNFPLIYRRKLWLTLWKFYFLINKVMKNPMIQPFIQRPFPTQHLLTNNLNIIQNKSFFSILCGKLLIPKTLETCFRLKILFECLVWAIIQTNIWLLFVIYLTKSNRLLSWNPILLSILRNSVVFVIRSKTTKHSIRLNYRKSVIYCNGIIDINDKRIYYPRVFTNPKSIYYILIESTKLITILCLNTIYLLSEEW